MSELEQLRSEISSAESEFCRAVTRYLLDDSGATAEADQAVAEIAETATRYSDVLERLIGYLKSTEIDCRHIRKDAIERTVAKASERRVSLQRLLSSTARGRPRLKPVFDSSVDELQKPTVPIG